MKAKIKGFIEFGVNKSLCVCEGRDAKLCILYKMMQNLLCFFQK